MRRHLWITDGGKIGLTDATTGLTLVPCEMDWMLRENHAPVWFLGKGNLVGGFAGQVLNHTAEDYYPPLYDAIDLSTGQFCLNGRWGWRMTDGTFTENPPGRKERYARIIPYVPLEHGAFERFHELQSKCGKLLPGVGRVHARFDVPPTRRLKLPDIYLRDIPVEPHPAVVSAFDASESGTVAISHGNHPRIKAVVDRVGDGKNHVTVSWTETDQIEMAVAWAFPLISACHILVRSIDGRFAVTCSIGFKVSTLDLPIAFISALLTFRDGVDSILLS